MSVESRRRRFLAGCDVCKMTPAQIVQKSTPQADPTGSFRANVSYASQEQQKFEEQKAVEKAGFFGSTAGKIVRNVAIAAAAFVPVVGPIAAVAAKAADSATFDERTRRASVPVRAPLTVTQASALPSFEELSPWAIAPPMAPYRDGSTPFWTSGISGEGMPTANLQSASWIWVIGAVAVLAFLFARR